ncbi:MAG TPA: GAF domain-containing protein, partial [Dehalococcoidia bacterium]|nr:GAF domain-containing protein [Dehalococcoidia bacterium]
MDSQEKPARPDDAGLDITLQDIVDSVEDELLVIDGDYRVKFANSVAQGRLQTEEKSPIGRLCYEALHGRDKPCSAPLWDCPLRKIFETGSMVMVIHPAHTRGVDTYLKITAYPLRDSSGNLRAMAELRRDVTAERDLETQILRRHHQLLALSHISSAVSGLQDLDAILRIALDNVLEIIAGAIGGILLLDEKTGRLYYRVQRGLSTTYTEGMQISLGEGIAGRVAQTGEPVLLEDISKDPHTANPDLISAEGLKSFVSIPLKVKGSVVGVMNIASHLAGRFGTDDVSLLNSIS